MVEFVFLHRQQYLTGTAPPVKARKDSPDRRLQQFAGIQMEASYALPYEGWRDRKAQPSAPRLGLDGFKQAIAQVAGLEGRECPLKSRQEPFVG